MDLMPNATTNYSLGGSLQVGYDERSKPLLWVKLCLKLPEHHINMSYAGEKQFQISMYMQFNDMNMRLLSLESYQNVECRTRGYYENRKNMTTGEYYTRYRQGSALVNSCGTNILTLETKTAAKSVKGN